MTTRFKHIHFVEVPGVPFSGKAIWECRNNKTDDPLAEMFWYIPWRKWTVRFNPSAVFDNGCLRDITAFLESMP